MLQLTIKEQPSDRRGDKRDFIVIINETGWDRFYEETPEIRLQTPARIVHPHPDFRRAG